MTDTGGMALCERARRALRGSCRRAHPGHCGPRDEATAGRPRPPCRAQRTANRSRARSGDRPGIAGAEAGSRREIAVTIRLAWRVRLRDQINPGTFGPLHCQGIRAAVRPSAPRGQPGTQQTGTQRTGPQGRPAIAYRHRGRIAAYVTRVNDGRSNASLRSSRWTRVPGWRRDGARGTSPGRGRPDSAAGAAGPSVLRRAPVRVRVPRRRGRAGGRRPVRRATGASR